MKIKPGSLNPFESPVSASGSTSSAVSKISKAESVTNWLHKSLSRKKKLIQAKETPQPGSKIPVLQKNQRKISFLSKLKYKKDRKAKVVQSEDKVVVGKTESLANVVHPAKSCSTIESQLVDHPTKLDDYPEIVETFKFLSDKLDSKSRIGLRESIEIYNQIEESKTNLTQIVSKYVQDESLTQDLIAILSNHAKLQTDSEARAQKLTYEMWLSQTEAMKQQGVQLKEDLNEAIKQNRDLHTEIEALLQKMEQLCMEKASNKDFSNHRLMEKFYENNEKLRQKLASMTNQIKSQERDIQIVQQENQSLESQLCNSNSQLYSYKSNLQKLQFENEIDRIQLTHQLQSKQSLVTKAGEAGKTLLETLKSLDSTNLANFENYDERSLPDLIKFCASNIADFSKGIGLKDEKVEPSLEKSKCDNCESQLKNLKQETSEVKNPNESENQFQKQLIEKEEEALLNKEKMLEYKSENDSLRMQLHGLKEILNSSQSEDVGKKLVETQEKLTCFQAQYYQLLSEKNYLVEQIQRANEEREAINQSQTNYYQFIQNQQQDLDTLKQNGIKLQKGFNQKAIEISSLKNDKEKLKNEKSIMKHVYHQLKSEIKRVQRLKKEITKMSMEANRLGMIAEYNKQIGQQFQSEVVQRDEKISELQSNVDKLSKAQIEHSKDKADLRRELKEICNDNKELNNLLVAEQQKIWTLNQNNMSQESLTNIKLKAVEEMQKVERAAMKELLEDYKTIVMQRENLISSQEELIQQINDLRANSLVHAKEVEQFKKRHVQDQEVAANCKMILKGFEETAIKIENDLVKSENSNAQLKEILENALKQTEDLESSKSYLQNNLQKLQSDLDSSRTLQMMLEKKADEDAEKLQSLEAELKSLKPLSNENSQLVEENLHLKRTNRELRQEFENELQKTIISHRELKSRRQEVEDLKMVLEDERHAYEQTLIQKELEFFEVDRYCKKLKEDLLDPSVDDFEMQSELLSECNLKQLELQNSLSKIRNDHKDCKKAIIRLETEKTQLEKLLKDTKVELEKIKTEFDQIIQDHVCQKKVMKDDLVQLAKEFGQTKNGYIRECGQHNKLLESHKNLSKKLLNTVELLIQEKVSRQHSESSIENLSQQLELLKIQKEAAENAIIVLNNECNNLKQTIRHDRNSTFYAESFSDQEYVINYQEMGQLENPFQEFFQEVHKEEKSEDQSDCTSKCSLLQQLDEKEEKIKQLKEEIRIKQNRILALELEVSKITGELTFAEFERSEASKIYHRHMSKLQTETDEHLAKIQERVLAEVLDMTQTDQVSPTSCQILVNLI